MSETEKTITLETLSGIWIKKETPEYSSEFSKVLDRILNPHTDSVSDSKDINSPVKQQNDSLLAVNMETILGDLAAQINQVEIDSKSKKKRWNAASIKDDVIIQSETLWRAIENRLDEMTKHQAQADKTIRYQLQVDVLQEMNEKGWLKKDVLKHGKVGAKLKVRLQNGSSFIITGFVMNLQAFADKQINEFQKRAEQYPILKNLAGYEVVEG